MLKDVKLQSVPADFVMLIKYGLTFHLSRTVHDTAQHQGADTTTDEPEAAPRSTPVTNGGSGNVNIE
jgi:hypothetical protein